MAPGSIVRCGALQGHVLSAAVLFSAYTDRT